MDHLFGNPLPDNEETALRRQVEELGLRLEKAEAEVLNLTMALDATAAGTWDWEISTGKLMVNACWAAILGYRLDELQGLTIKFWEEHCHPDDLEESNRRLQEHFDGKSGHYEMELRIRHRDGHWVWVLDRGKLASRGAEGLPLRMIGSHQEISRRKLAEQSFGASRAFERLTTTIANRFINLPSHEIDSMILSTLQLIGEQVGADRSYIFEFSDDLTLMDNTYEWCAAGITPQIKLLKELPTSIFPWWMQQIREIRTIHIPSIADMPEEASPEQEILQEQGIKSLIAIPLASGKGPFGYIGFDAVNAARTWSDETVSIMKLAGGIIANAIRRKRVEKIVQAEFDLALRLNSTASFEETLHHILQSALNISGLESGGIYLLDHERREMKLACHSGLSDEFLDACSSYAFDTPQAQLILEGKPVYTDHTRIDFAPTGVPWHEPPSAIALLPVAYHGEMIACLNIVSTRFSRISECARKALETIASYIGATIAHARQELHVIETKTNLESLFDTIEDMVFVIDIGCRVIATNPAVSKILGFTPGEVVGRLKRELHPEEQREEADLVLQGMISGDVTECTIPLLTAGGELVNVFTRSVKGIWNKQPVIFGISRDISGLVRSQRDLLENRQQLRGLTELLPLPLFEVDTNLELTYGNHICNETFGYDRPEMECGFDAMKLCVPEEYGKFSARLLNIMGKLPKQPRDNDYTCIRKDGSRFPALFYGMPIVKNGETVGVSGLFVDLSETRMAEEAMRISEIQTRIAQEFKSLIDNIPGAVYRINRGEATMLSMYPDALPGITREEFERDLLGSRKMIHPEDRQNVIDSQRRLEQERKSLTLTYRIIDRNGATRWIEDRKTSSFAQDGGYIGIDGILFDITTRIRAHDEKQQLESRLRKSQRLETIGTLAGGIAHDFNNILTPILGYAEMGVMSQTQEPELCDYFSEIMQAAERAQNLVAQILTFSRAQESTPMPMSVQAIVNEALKLLRPSIPTTIDIEQHIDRKCRNILADPSQIHQVIVNLCTNAFQAMERSAGKLQIDLKEVLPDATLQKMLPKLRQRPYIRLSVSDTGSGMDEATMERIFEPFFTTKPVDRGTGLGLSVVHGIIASCHGEISVESTPDKGTTFTIYLPVIDEQAPHSSTEEKPMRGSGRILFVDDEQAAVDMMTLMLTKLGFTIHAEKSPIAALHRFIENPAWYDLVITDLTMPGMTGLQLSETLRKSRPDIPVILMTGYGKNIDIAFPLNRYGISKLLKKPVKLAQLASAVNELLITNNKSSAVSS